MKVVGLITEYNPFHNGHKYHIEEAKRITEADYAIAVMSGNFVQRGIPAVIDKYSRTQMALNNGIDLVLELPVCYATGSAEYFAHGAVSLLNKLGSVDSLCFGSESGNLELLTYAAEYLISPPATFEATLQTFLKQGFTYPAARWKAMEQCTTTHPDRSAEDKAKHLNEQLDHSMIDLFTEPNNILGIEYMKALLSFKSSIKATTIKRIAAHYHESNLNKSISSATAIRKAIHSKADTTADYFDELESSVPKDVYQILKEHYKKTYPITEEDFSQIIKYKLLSEDKRGLVEYLDITGDLADRMKNTTNYHKSIQELTNEIKSKNMTMTRISRALIHLLLNIKTANLLQYNSNGYVPYARVLGVRKDATRLLRHIDLAGQIPVITKVAKAHKQLNPIAMQMLSEDIFATHLYHQIVYEKYGTLLLNEYKRGIIIQ